MEGKGRRRFEAKAITSSFCLTALIIFDGYQRMAESACYNDYP